MKLIDKAAVNFESLTINYIKLITFTKIFIGHLPISEHYFSEKSTATHFSEQNLIGPDINSFITKKFK